MGDSDDRVGWDWNNVVWKPTEGQPIARFFDEPKSLQIMLLGHTRIVINETRIVFMSPEDKEILALEADGSIVARGERVYAKDVVDGLRDWLKPILPRTSDGTTAG